jgi:meckelin
MYDTSADVCRAFNAIANTRGGSINGWAGWASTMPFLYYSAAPLSVLDSAALTQAYSFDSTTQQDTIDKVNLLIATYNLTGHLQSLKPLFSEFAFCVGTGSRVASGSPIYLAYGVSATQRTTCDLTSLIGSALSFYELFIVDTASATSTEANPSSLPYRLYPVPVRITNLLSGGATPNSNPDTGSSTDDVLVRRFTLVDARSGVTSAGAATEYVRYASSLVLSIDSQTDNVKLIKPPSVTLTYKTRQSSLFGSNADYASDVVTVSAVYSSDNTEYNNTALGLLAVSMVFFAMLGVLRMYNWWRRNFQRNEAWTCGQVLPKGLLVAGGAFAHVMFALLWVLTTYWLLFFKLQDAVFQLMPIFRPDFQAGIYSTFETFIWLIWVGQFLRIVDLTWEQCSVDIFFVDWEKRKGPLLHTAQLDGYDDLDDALPAGSKQKPMGAPDAKPDDPRSRSSRSAATWRGSERHAEEAETARRHKYAPVSIWRKLFMANEWSELQSDRRIRLWLTLFVLVAIMEGGNVKNVAVARPGTADLSDDVINPAIQFANNAFWWGVLCLSQYILVWGVYERFITEPPTLRYLDLCSIAKISIIVMPHKYSGFYLHCDAPYEYADCTMAQMTDHLQDERGEVLVGRGLPGAPNTNAQEFVLWLPMAFRLQYDSIYRQFNTKVLETAAEARRNAVAGGASLPRTSMSTHYGRPMEDNAGIRVDAAKGAPAYDQHTLPQEGLAGAAQTIERNGQAAADAAGVRQTSLKDSRNVAVTKVLEVASKTLSGFVKAFVTKEGTSGLLWEFRDVKLLQRWCGLTPEMEELQQAHGISTMGGMSASGTTGVAMMQEDVRHSWESVMWRGQEVDLILWDFLMYTVVDFYTQSPTSAALTTYILSVALDYVRTQWGQTNISRKTLIDDRFLD